MKIKNKDTIKKDQKFSIEPKSYYNKREMEVMYRIIREYIYEHQGENAVQVSDMTGVPRNIIMTFLRQGKISLAENSKHLLYKCSVCGGLIDHGDMCPDCRRIKIANILYPETKVVSNKKHSSKYSASNPQEINYGRRVRKK